jgi:hypothetical protein
MRRTLIIGGAIVTVIVATSVWRLTTGDTQTATPAAKSPVEAAAAGAQSARTQIEPGATTTTTTTTLSRADRSETSAVSAAVRFLELDEALFPGVSPTEARTMSDSITSTNARERLGKRAEQHQRELLAKGDLQGLILRIAPISVRVRNHTLSSSTVDIFLLRLWSFPKSGALDDYATAQLDLVWEANQWRLADSSVIDGPYPVARFTSRPVLASTAKRFEDSLAGYDDKELYR